jgi:hypothetical protein
MFEHKEIGIWDCPSINIFLKMGSKSAQHINPPQIMISDFTEDAEKRIWDNNDKSNS